MPTLVATSAPHHAVLPDPEHEHRAALTNFFAHPAADFEPFPLPRVTAWLNHADRIMGLPSHWELFAAMIGSPELRREDVLGRPVARFIEDATVRESFRVLLDRIRREGRAARMSLRFDHADQARAMQLRLAPMSAGAVEISWNFFQGFTAEEIRPVDVHAHHGEHVRMCSWCNRVSVRNRWEKLEYAIPALGMLEHEPIPAITHGICELCGATMADDGVLERAGERTAC